MNKVLKSAHFDTKLGSMIAVADDQSLYLLEFVDRQEMESEVQRLQHRLKCSIETGSSPVLNLVEQELDQYFAGTLTQFTIPFITLGSPFQKSVWQALLKIPYGETRSYADIAQNIGMPMAFRAVANANRANCLSIIIPCHRVIKSDGDLCGYGGGVARKEWLINHEKSRG